MQTVSNYSVIIYGHKVTSNDGILVWNKLCGFIIYFQTRVVIIPMINETDEETSFAIYEEIFIIIIFHETSH